jgi:hypothetical protein
MAISDARPNVATSHQVRPGAQIVMNVAVVVMANVTASRLHCEHEIEIAKARDADH